MDKEREFQRMLGLFKKSFSDTLNEEGKKELGQLLEDKSLFQLHQEMQQGKLVREGLANQYRFSHRKAFSDFENRTRFQKTRRSVLFRRMSRVAAILLVGFTLAILHFVGTRQEKASMVANSSNLITPGYNKALLRLENGEIITLAGNPIEMQEKGGTNIRYENGTVSYTSKEPDTEERFNELTVPAGGECYLVFDDGTKVWLNAVTKLKYPTKFSGDERKIYLEGEAFFDVTPDTKPFIVHTSLGEVRVLGTTFGVCAYEDEAMATTLVTGKVVYDGRDTVFLNPGEQVVAHASGIVEKHKVDVEEFVGWKNGLYVFNKRTLGTIMKDFERWYDVSVTFLDPKLKELLFSGDVERYDNINTFLELLESTEEVRYLIKDKHITLYR